MEMGGRPKESEGYWTVHGCCLFLVLGPVIRSSDESTDYSDTYTLIQGSDGSKTMSCLRVDECHSKRRESNVTLSLSSLPKA
jgi:hypothetical protein